MKTKLPVGALVLVTTVAGLSAGFAPGGAAYTKRVETALLSEPKMLATATTRVPYATRLKVEDVQGNWLRVSDGRKTGWVFGGNLTEEKPSETRGLDGLPLAASQTSAATAARPLTPASEQYSGRHGLETAASDLIGRYQQRGVSTPEKVQAFLEAHKKGEFQ